MHNNYPWHAFKDTGFSKALCYSLSDKNDMVLKDPQKLDTPYLKDKKNY